MNISYEFRVRQPIEAVWAAFQDVPSVAQCLPGAELKEDKGGGVYAGAVKVKLGPMSAEFEGEAKVSPDAVSRRGHIEGKGVDRSGGSRGQMKVDYALIQLPDETRVTVDTEISLSGAIGQFGRSGIVEEMSRRLIDEFVECLEAKLAAETPEEANEIEASEVKGISLFFAALGSWLGNFFKRLFGRK